MNNDNEKYCNLAVSRYYASISNKKRFKLMRFKKIFDKPLEKITEKLLEFYNMDIEEDQQETMKNILLDRLDLDDLYSQLEETLD